MSTADLQRTLVPAPSHDFLRSVERGLASALATDGGLEPITTPATLLVTASGAKRARPWLVHLFGSALDLGPSDALVDAAIGVELIHTASLLHDDVVDEATERRGAPSANHRFGNVRAVLGGDWALTCALVRLGRRPAFLRPALEVVGRMTRAIAVELDARHQLIPLPAWDAMARGKTGALFGLCGQLAGLAARDEERGEAFMRCGEALGVAFQIADDLADLTDRTDLGGKGRFNDLRTGSPNHAVLWAAAEDAALARDLRRVWEDSTSDSIQHELADLGSRVIALGAVEAADRAAHRAVEDARRALGRDAQRPALAGLLGWAEALVDAAARKAA